METQTIQSDILCRACKASLRGVAVAGLCPHCRRSIPEMIDTQHLDLATGLIVTDWSCIECRYNLRTLSVNANCPECNRPVADSLQPDDLRFTDAKWLRDVRFGITVLLVTVPAALILTFLMAIMASMGGLFAALAVVSGLLAFLATLFGVGGFVITCQRTPDSLALRQPFWPHRAALLLPIYLLLSFFMSLFSLMALSIDDVLLVFFGLVVALFCTIGVGVSIIAMTYCLQQIAQRGHKLALGRLTFWWRMVLFPAVGLPLAIVFLGALFALHSSTPFPFLLDSMALGFAFFALVGVVMGMFVLSMYRRLLTAVLNQVAAARDNVQVDSAERGVNDGE